VRGSLREDAGGYHGGPGVRVLRRERSGLEPSTAELPKPVEIPNVQPDVLLRTDLPNVPGKMLIVVRTTYAPGLHVAPAKSSLHSTGRDGVRDQGKASFTLKAGDSLLIKPGTVHEHWNASGNEPLVFLEYVLVDKGQRSAVFVK